MLDRDNAGDGCDFRSQGFKAFAAIETDITELDC